MNMPIDDLFFILRLRQELLEDAVQNNRPFPTWDGATVVAWLEVGLARPRKGQEGVVIDLVMGENASLVCCRLSCQCQIRCDHVRIE